MTLPGLQMGQQMGASTPYMRGVGNQNTSIGDEGSVATYVDGAYTNSLIGAISALNNVERVEVLKGPQGTLFGRNTTGGVLSIITRDPSQESELEIGVRAGNYETWGGDFYGSTGLSNDLAANLAVTLQRQDEGFGTNLVNGEDVQFNEYTQVRNEVSVHPGERTDIKLSFSYTDKDSDIGPARICLPGKVCNGIVAPPGVIFPPSRPAETRLSNFHDVNLSFTPSVEHTGWATSLRLDHGFEFFDFVSITAYNDSESVQHFSADSLSFPVSDIILDKLRRPSAKSCNFIPTARTSPIAG